MEPARAADLVAGPSQYPLAPRPPDAGPIVGGASPAAAIGAGTLATPDEPLAKIPSAELAGWLARPDSFWRETAQQELVERGDLSVVPALENWALHGREAYTRVAALWTLDGLNATTLNLLGRALRDPEPKVRQAAVRLHEPFLRGERGLAAVSGGEGPPVSPTAATSNLPPAPAAAPTSDALATLDAAAAPNSPAGSDAAAAARRALATMIDDPTSDVLIQLALTLGDDASAAALPLMRKLYGRRRIEPWIVPALVTGLDHREFAFIALAATRGSAESGQGPLPSPERPHPAPSAATSGALPLSPERARFLPDLRPGGIDGRPRRRF